MACGTAFLGAERGAEGAELRLRERLLLLGTALGVGPEHDCFDSKAFFPLGLPHQNREAAFYISLNALKFYS